MTCVAAIFEDRTLHIISDSLLLWEYPLDNHGPKFFQKGPYIIGYAGSIRGGQILEYSTKLPDAYEIRWYVDKFGEPDREVMRKFMLEKVIPAIQNSFRENGFSQGTDDTLGVVILVSVGAYMCIVAEDYCVVDCGTFAAIGSGSTLALSSLETTEELNKSHDKKDRKIDPHTRLMLAMESASKYNNSVGNNRWNYDTFYSFEPLAKRKEINR